MKQFNVPVNLNIWEVKERTPDYVIPITGFRVWKLRYGKNLLCSPQAQTDWPTYEELNAICIHNNYYSGSFHLLSRTPAMGCSCGIYAFKSFWRCLEYWREFNITDMHIFGKVALWGKVIEHRHGYLAEKAYPVELYIPRWAGESLSMDIELTAINYGIKAILHTNGSNKKSRSWRFQRN